MIAVAFLDSDNWVDGICWVHMDELPSDIEQKKHIRLTPEEFREMNRGTEIFWFDGNRFVQLMDKKKIWHRLRSLGLSGRRLMDRIEELTPTPGSSLLFPAAPDNIPIGMPQPLRKIYPSMDFSYEIQPGLSVRSVKFEELDRLEQALLDTGFYPDREACWKRAWGWFSDPHVQLLSVVWNNEPLMMEVYYFSAQGNYGDPYYGFDTNTAFSRFTVHLDKERPHWFWRACSLPVFNALKRNGIRRITTTPIREDRGDWKEILKKYYGAKTYKIAPDGSKESLEYDLETAINKVEDFPQRKTMGPGWEWQDEDIRIIEADALKLEDAIQDVKNVMVRENDPRIATIDRDIRAWWELDKASVLLALKDGNLVDMRLFRLKEGRTNRVWTIPGSWKLEIDLARRIALGAAEWQRNVGYEKSLVIMPQKLYDHPKMKEKNELFGGNFKRKLIGRKDVIEVEYDLQTVIERAKRGK